MRTILSCLLLLPLGLNTRAAADAQWTNAGPDARWSSPGNWQSGRVPGAESIGIRSGIGDDHAAVLDHPHNRDDDDTRLRVGWGPNQPGELRLQDQAELHVGLGSFIGEETRGVVRQQGGNFRVGYGTFRIGSKDGGDGYYLLEDGVLDVARASTPEGESLHIGHRGADGHLEVRGGVLLTRGNVLVGPQGKLTVSGSRIQGIRFGDANATVGADLELLGTLHLHVDAHGIAKIVVDQGNDGDAEEGGGGHVIFGPHAKLNVSATNNAPPEGEWLVLEWDGRLQSNELDITAAPDRSAWNVDFRDTDADGQDDSMYLVRNSSSPDANQVFEPGE
jgi:hypothetical protein